MEAGRSYEDRLAEQHKQVENAKVEIAKPFPDEVVLEEKCKRLDELNSELNMNKKDNELAEDDAVEVDESDRDMREEKEHDSDVR